MTNEERLKVAGWRTAAYELDTPPCGDTPYKWTQDGIDWYTEDEALVVVLTAERDAAIARAETLQRTCDMRADNLKIAIARAEAAEALAASMLDVSPEDAEAYDRFVRAMFDGNAIPMAVWTRAERARDALRAHAAKVSR